MSIRIRREEKNRNPAIPAHPAGIQIPAPLNQVGTHLSPVLEVQPGLQRASRALQAGPDRQSCVEKSACGRVSRNVWAQNSQKLQLAAVPAGVGPRLSPARCFLHPRTTPFISWSWKHLHPSHSSSDRCVEVPSFSLRRRRRRRREGEREEGGSERGGARYTDLSPPHG